MICESVVVLPPPPFQALKEDFPLSHVISPFTNQERREGMLLNLLIPFVLTVGSGSKGKEQTSSKNVWIERLSLIIKLRKEIEAFGGEVVKLLHKHQYYSK